MLKVSETSIRNMEKRYPGITEQIQDFENMEIPHAQNVHPLIQRVSRQGLSDALFTQPWQRRNSNCYQITMGRGSTIAILVILNLVRKNACAYNENLWGETKCPQGIEEVSALQVRCIQPSSMRRPMSSCNRRRIEDTIHSSDTMFRVTSISPYRH